MNILYAEDYAPFRSMVEKRLSSLGYNVTQVSDGYEALKELASGKRFDAIISDGHMVSTDKTKAELNGHTLLNMPEAKVVPIKILLSSNADIYKDAAQKDKKNNIYFLGKSEDSVIEKLDTYIKRNAPFAGASQSSKPGKIPTTKSPHIP